MAQALLDPRLIIPGFHGELYDLETGTFLAWCNTWQAQVNVNNNDYQPASSALTYAVISNFSVTLTLTETQVQDALLLQRLLQAMRTGTLALFNFQGKIHAMNGTTGIYNFRNCVPDGAIDVANITPGDIIQRSWSFRVNDYVDLQELLSY